MKGKLKETDDKLRSYFDGTIDKRINKEGINGASDFEIHLLRTEKHAIRLYLIHLFNRDYKTYKMLDLYYREELYFTEVAKKFGLERKAASRRRLRVVKDLYKIL